MWAGVALLMGLILAAPTKGDAALAAEGDEPLVAYVDSGDQYGDEARLFVTRGSGPARRIGDDAPYQRQPAWSPDGDLIAFSRDGDVAVIRPDGGGLRIVADTGGFDSAPEWSPDGQRIAFQGSDGLHVVDRDGGGARRVTDSPDDGAPAWSPDGRHLAFGRETGTSIDFGPRQSDVFVVDVESGKLRRLTSDGRSRGPRWSPDGALVSMSSGGDLVVVSPDGVGPRTVATDADPGRWSPDGTMLAFIDRTTERVSIVGADGSGRRPLGDGVTGSAPVRWTSDGRSIVLSSHSQYRGGGLIDLSEEADLFSVSVEDGSVRQLTDSGSAVGPAVAPFPPFVERAAGRDRISTALAVSRRAFRCADGVGCARTVVLARTDDPADALVGVPLAASLDAPVLLTPTGSLDAEVAAEVARLGADEAVLLGGPSALSTEVARALEEAGVSRVRRVAGPTRFATAAAVAREIDPTSVYLAAADTGGWADAVSAGALAGSTGQAVLLTERDRLPGATEEVLAELSPETAVVMGGRAAVAADVEEQLGRLVPDVTRLAGATRYDTAALAADRSVAEGVDPARVWMATGRNWPDALAAGAAAVHEAGVVLLVDGEDAAGSPEALQWVLMHRDVLRRIVLVGGSSAISPRVQVAIGTAAHAVE